MSKSATLRPLKLLYSVILIADTLGLIFIQNKHKDLGNWKWGDSARDHAEKWIKRDLLDPNGLNIPESKVRVHEDKTKSEIEAIFK